MTSINWHDFIRQVSWRLQGSPHDVVANWVFVNPLATQLADDSLSRKGKKKLQGLASKRHLSDIEVESLKRELGTDANGNDLVQVVHQRPHSIITIPAGWLHQVTNLRLCVKLAWELIDPNKLYMYALAWQFIASRITMHNAPDYMFSENILLNQVRLVVKLLSRVNTKG